MTKQRESEAAARARACLFVGNHTRSPSGYLALFEWAMEKNKTHVQKRCPGCKLWVIWEPKKEKAGA